MKSILKFYSTFNVFAGYALYSLYFSYLTISLFGTVLKVF